jgi:hypothetical protein
MVTEFYTAARYYRPSGRSVQLVGVEPDIEAFDRPGSPPAGRVVLREGDLFPTALPSEPELRRQPGSRQPASLLRCVAEEGLATHRWQRETKGNGVSDHALNVSKDALTCILRHP